MHVRFSMALGLPVCEEGSSQALGVLSQVIVHPDTGKVEGFLVRSGTFFGQDYFLSSMDILRWSLRIVVRSADVLCDPREIIRIEPLLTLPRPILGQQIVTEGDKPVGRCADLQFDTTHFMLEWIFPRWLWKWGVPIPANQILEVRPDAIVIRDLKADLKEKAEVPAVTLMAPVGEAEVA